MIEDTGKKSPWAIDPKIRDMIDPPLYAEMRKLAKEDEKRTKAIASIIATAPIPTLTSLSNEIAQIKARVTEIEAALKGLADRP